MKKIKKSLYANMFFMLDSNIKYEVIMINCSSCGKFLTKARAQENMSTCIRCSDVQPYSAHIVYPHKTGAFVQPVTKEQKDHIQRLDRRAVKIGRKIKGGSSSWDRWFKNYQKQKSRVSYNGNTSAFQADAVGSIPSTRSIKQKALDIYKKDGYWSAIDKINHMFKTGSISLVQKCTINSFLSSIKVQNKKAQRLILNETS